MPTASNPGVESVIVAIALCELKYRDYAEEEGLGEEEFLQMLDDFLPYLIDAFDSQVPPPSERGGGLALKEALYEWRALSGDADPEARRAAAVRSFLAAETERGGQFRLTRSQHARLGAHDDALGEEFLALGLPAHAALAYQAAAEMHLWCLQKSQCRSSLLRQRRAQRQARPPGLRRTMDALCDAVCGYGYRPFRMLGWMALILVLFSVAVWLSGSPGYVTSLHACLIDFLNPLTFGDLDPAFSGPAQVLLVAESYFGAILTAIFFALLVRG